MTNVVDTGKYYDYINDKLMKNPYMFLAIALVFVFYFFFVKYLGQRGHTELNLGLDNPSDENTSFTILKIIVAIIVLGLICSNVLKYIFDIDIKVGLKHIFSKVPIINVKILNDLGKKIVKDGGNLIKDSENIVENTLLDGEELMERPEVFNIPDNVYTYDEADALCKAYDAKLANYNQIENAYNQGGEWCSYGWSSDQMILYPTQQNTYNKLKTIKGHEHDCGRPGINGGYIGNKQAKFGVNCYGIKPPITHKEKKLMDRNNIYPDSKKDRCQRKKVRNLRKYIKNILISPFNPDEWND